MVGDAALVGRYLKSGGGTLVFHVGTKLVSIDVEDHYPGGGGPGSSFARTIEGFATAIIPRT